MSYTYLANQTTGFMHSHPGENTCFSPADVMNLSGLYQANGNPNVISIMADPNHVYTLKITDPAGLAAKLAEKNLAGWNTVFGNEELANAGVNGQDHQGQEAAILKMFGAYISVQRADYNSDGSIGSFKNVQAYATSYSDISGNQHNYYDTQSKPCNDYR